MSASELSRDDASAFSAPAANEVAVRQPYQLQAGLLARPEEEQQADDSLTLTDLGRIILKHKWTLLIVIALDRNTVRFTELQQQIPGISQRMLTLSLRGLERDGLVTRTVTPTIPPRVDYELTQLGVSLREPVRGLGDWAIAHIECIRAAQERFDRRGEA